MYIQRILNDSYAWIGIYSAAQAPKNRSDREGLGRSERGNGTPAASLTHLYAALRRLGFGVGSDMPAAANIYTQRREPHRRRGARNCIALHARVSSPHLLRYLPEREISSNYPILARRNSSSC